MSKLSVIMGLAIWLFTLASCSEPPSQNHTETEASTATSTKDVNAEKTKDTEETDFFAPLAIDFAQADPVLGHIGSRKLQSLNGDWKIIIDPMGIGNPRAISPGFPADQKPETGMELIEYNFNTAETISVPGDWNSQKERLFFYRGHVWYRKLFQAQPAPGSLQHLHFGGANFDAQIFLNGEPVGEHRGGYVPFSFDVTDTLKKGQNSLVIRIDNQLGKSTIPTGRTDWWPYGGLTRDVALIETPKSFIRNSKIWLSDRESGEVTVRVMTSGARAGSKAKIEISELGLTKDLIIGSGGEAEITFNAAPQLWSPDNPKLYDVALTLNKDKITDRIGFRTIETRGTEILLNGEPIKLRGISTHEEPIGEPGVAYSRDHASGLLKAAKALNANFVRAAHYPYSRHMAEAADELGLMLWEEIPVYWQIDWTNPETLAIARDQMARLVERDWSRASVIIWSVANETPASDARMAFLETLISDTRDRDDSRLISAALLGGDRESFERLVTHLAVRGLEKGGYSTKTNMIFRAIKLRAGRDAPKPDDAFVQTITDPLGELTDIVAYNEYFGWYYSMIFADQTGIPEGVLRELMLELMPLMRIDAAIDKPVHISEFGAGAKAGNTGGEALIFTEEYQAKLYEAQIAMLRNSPQVQGMTPWILKDFRAMLRPLGGTQDFYNRKGLIDEKGQKKQAYFVLQEFYAGDWNP